MKLAPSLFLLLAVLILALATAEARPTPSARFGEPEATGNARLEYTCGETVGVKGTTTQTITYRVAVTVDTDDTPGNGNDPACQWAVGSQPRFHIKGNCLDGDALRSCDAAFNTVRILLVWDAAEVAGTPTPTLVSTVSVTSPWVYAWTDISSNLVTTNGVNYDAGIMCADPNANPAAFPTDPCRHAWTTPNEGPASNRHGDASANGLNYMGTFRVVVQASFTNTGTAPESGTFHSDSCYYYTEGTYSCSNTDGGYNKRQIGFIRVAPSPNVYEPQHGEACATKDHFAMRGEPVCLKLQFNATAWKSSPDVRNTTTTRMPTNLVYRDAECFSTTECWVAYYDIVDTKIGIVKATIGYDGRATFGTPQDLFTPTPQTGTEFDPVAIRLAYWTSGTNANKLFMLYTQMDASSESSGLSMYKTIWTYDAQAGTFSETQAPRRIFDGTSDAVTFEWLSLAVGGSASDYVMACSGRNAFFSGATGQVACIAWENILNDPASGAVSGGFNSTNIDAGDNTDPQRAPFVCGATGSDAFYVAYITDPLLASTYNVRLQRIVRTGGVWSAESESAREETGFPASNAMSSNGHSVYCHHDGTRVSLWINHLRDPLVQDSHALAGRTYTVTSTLSGTVATHTLYQPPLASGSSEPVVAWFNQSLYHIAGARGEGVNVRAYDPMSGTYVAMTENMTLPVKGISLSGNEMLGSARLPGARNNTAIVAADEDRITVVQVGYAEAFNLTVKQGATVLYQAVEEMNTGTKNKTFTVDHTAGLNAYSVTIQPIGYSGVSRSAWNMVGCTTSCVMPYDTTEDWESGSTEGELWWSLGGLLGVTPVTPCASSGSYSARFLATTGSSAEIQTVGLEMRQATSVSFKVRTGDGTGACGTAGTPNTPLHLHYSTNGGSVWTLIDTVTAATFSSFTTQTMTVPAGAKTANTILRWSTTTQSGSQNWFVDDITFGGLANPVEVPILQYLAGGVADPDGGTYATAGLFVEEELLVSACDTTGTTRDVFNRGETFGVSCTVKDEWDTTTNNGGSSLLKGKQVYAHLYYQSQGGMLNGAAVAGGLTTDANGIMSCASCFTVPTTASGAFMSDDTYAGSNNAEESPVSRTNTVRVRYPAAASYGSTGSYGEPTAFFDYDDDYYLETSTVAWSTMMRADEQRVRATIHNARDLPVPSGTSVGVAIERPSAVTETSGTRTTDASGLTSVFDWTADAAESTGAWLVKYDVLASTGANLGNNMQSTTGVGFTLSSTIGQTSVAPDVAGQTTTDYFNRGESVTLAATLRHADGGAYRKLNADGTASTRTVDARVYSSTPTETGNWLGSATANSGTGAWTATTSISDSAVDTYSSSAHSQAETKDWAAHFYDSGESATTTTGNRLTVSNVWDVDGNYYRTSNSVTWSTVMREDEQRATANFAGVRGQGIPDGVWVGIEYIDPTGIVRLDAGRQFSGGSISPADYEFPLGAERGTWTMRHYITANATNHMNSYAPTTGATFTLASVIGLAGGDVDVAGQSTSRYFNRGETVRVAGTLTHADGNPYRKLKADGTTVARVISVHLYLDTRGSTGSFTTGSANVPTGTGIIAAASTDTSVPSNAPDSYASSAAAQAEAVEWDLLIFDGTTPGTASNVDGNYVNVTDFFDVDAQYYYVSSTRSPSGDMMRGDTVGATVTLNNVRGVSVPNGVTVTTRFYGTSAVWQTSTSTTTSGTTSRVDGTLPNTQANGAWTVRFLVPSGASGASENTLAETVGQTYTVTSSITIESADTNTSSGDDAFKVYNRGDQFTVTGCLKHADGGVYRIKTPTGDAARTITVQAFLNAHASGDQYFEASTTVGPSACTFSRTLTTPTSAFDTFNRTAVRTVDADGYNWDLRVYDGGTSNDATIGNTAQTTNLLDLDANYYLGADFVRWSTVMRNDQQRVTSTWRDAQDVLIRDATDVTVALIDTAGTPVTWSTGTRATTSGVTANYDYTFTQDAFVGTWWPTYSISASASSDQNSAPASTLTSFSLSRTIGTTSFDADVAGQVTSAYFNRGETVRVALTLTHADGGAYRRLMADGTTQARSIAVHHYETTGGRGGTGSFTSGTAAVSASTGVVTSASTDAAVPTNAPDTYASSTPGQVEGLGWSTYTHDGGSATNNEGNAVTQAASLDVDANYYHTATTKTPAGAMMRGDTVGVTGAFVGVRSQNVPNGVTVTVRFEDATGAVWSTTTRTTTAGTTARADSLIPNTAAVGATAAFTFEVLSGASGANENTMGLTPDAAAYTLSKDITIESFGTNTSTAGGVETSDIFKVYNRGEHLKVTGCLRHADGGVYRVKHPDLVSEAGRTVNVQAFLNNYAGEGYVEAAAATTATDCTFATVLQLAASASVYDTFNRTAPRTIDGDGYNWDLRIYDGGSSSSATNGNNAESLSAFDADATYYMASNTLAWSVVMRNDQDRVTTTWVDGQDTPVPDGTSVWSRWLPDGLVAWWKFDEGTGTTATDNTRLGAVANLQSSAAWTTGVSGSALDIPNDGTAQVTTGSLSIRTGGAASKTVEMWVRPTQFFANGGVLFSTVNLDATADSRGYAFFIDGSGRMAFRLQEISGTNGDSNYHETVTSTTALSLNTWQHVAAAYNGTSKEVRMYINGALVGSGTFTKATVINHGVGTIARFGAEDPSGSEYRFIGAIDEARFWDTADVYTGSTIDLEEGARTTTSGVTANYDYTLPQYAYVGQWTPTHNVTANATNNQNSAAASTSASFTLSRNIGISGKGIDVAGQTTVDYFNRGETVRFAGSATHADGGPYRRLLADGSTADRTLAVHHYLNAVGAAGSVSSTTVTIPRATGIVPAGLDATLPTNAPDTYESSTPSQAEGLAWDTYAFDGGSATNANGNAWTSSDWFDVDANYYKSGETTAWGIVMRDDEQRLRATFVGVRSQTVPDNVQVTVALVDPTGVTRQSGDRATISGLTTVFDYTFPLGAERGTWQVKYEVVGSTSGNSGNSYASTNGLTFVLASEIGISVQDVDVAGQSTSKYFNRGETVRFAGTLTHADGSPYRKLKADGTTTARSAGVYAYLDTRGASGAFTSGTAAVTVSTGVMDATFTDVAVPTNAPDTYASTAYGQSEAVTWDAMVYDGTTPGTSTNHDGNYVNITDFFDIDANYYLDGHALTWTTPLLRGDIQRVTADFAGVRGQNVPDGTVVTVRWYDGAPSLEETDTASTTGGAMAAQTWSLPDGSTNTPGTAHVSFEIVAATAGNANNALAETASNASNEWQVSTTITIESIDTNLTTGDVALKAYNRGESYVVSGCLKHPDGGVLRQKLSTGTSSSRTVRIQSYNAAGGIGSVGYTQTNVTVGPSTCTFSTTHIVQTNAPDTYTSAVSATFDGAYGWGVRTFTGTNAVASTNGGNSGQQASVFDVDAGVYLDRWWQGRNDTDSTDIDFNTGTNGVTGPDSDYTRLYLENVRGEATTQFDNLRVTRDTRNPNTLAVTGSSTPTLTVTGSMYRHAWGQWTTWTNARTDYAVSSADSNGNTVVHADPAATSKQGEAHYVVGKVETLDTHVMRGQAQLFTVSAADSYEDYADNAKFDFSAGVFTDNSVDVEWTLYTDDSTTTTTGTGTFTDQSSPYQVLHTESLGTALGYRDLHLTLAATPYGKLLGEEWVSHHGSTNHHDRFGAVGAEAGQTVWRLTNQTDWERGGWRTGVDTTTESGALRVAAGATVGQWNSSIRDLGEAAGLLTTGNACSVTIGTSGSVHAWLNASSNNFVTTLSATTSSYSTPSSTGTMTIPDQPMVESRYHRLTLKLTGDAKVTECTLNYAPDAGTALSDGVGAWRMDDLQVTNVTTDRSVYDLDVDLTVDARITYGYVLAQGTPENETYTLLRTRLYRPGPDVGVGVLASVPSYADKNTALNATTNQSGQATQVYTLTTVAQAGANWYVDADTHQTASEKAFFAVKPRLSNTVWSARINSNAQNAYTPATLHQRGEQVRLESDISNNPEGYQPSSATVTDDVDGTLLSNSVSYDGTQQRFTAVWLWPSTTTANYGTEHRPVVAFTLNNLTVGTSPSTPAKVYSNFTIRNIWHALNPNDVQEADIFIIGAHLMWEWANQFNIRGEPYDKPANYTWTHQEPNSGSVAFQNPPFDPAYPSTVSTNRGSEPAFNEGSTGPHVRTGLASVSVVAPAGAWRITANASDGLGNNATRTENVAFNSPVTPWNFRCTGHAPEYRVGMTVNMSCYFLEKQADGSAIPVEPTGTVYIQWFTKSLNNATLTNMTPRMVMNLTEFRSDDPNAQAAFGARKALAWGNYTIPSDIALYINKGLGFRVDTVHHGIAIDYHGSIETAPTENIGRVVSVSDVMLQPGKPASFQARTTLNHPVLGPIAFGPDSCNTPYQTNATTCLGDQQGTVRIVLKAINASCNCWATYNDPQNPVNDGTSIISARLTPMEKDQRFTNGAGAFGYTYTYNWTPPGDLTGKKVYAYYVAEFYGKNVTHVEEITVNSAGGVDPLEVRVPQHTYIGSNISIVIDSHYLNATARDGAASVLTVTIQGPHPSDTVVATGNPVQTGEGQYKYNWTPVDRGQYTVKVVTPALSGGWETRSGTFWAEYDTTQNLSRIDANLSRIDTNITSLTNESINRTDAWFRWLGSEIVPFQNVTKSTDGNRTNLTLGFWHFRRDAQMAATSSLPPFFVRGTSTTLWSNLTMTPTGLARTATDDYELRVTVNGVTRSATATVTYGPGASVVSVPVTFAANTLAEGEGVTVNITLLLNGQPVVWNVTKTSVHKVGYAEARSFESGWRFTSLPNLVGNVTVEEAFAGWDVDIVKWYGPNGVPYVWQKNDPQGLNNLLTVNRTAGLWVHLVKDRSDVVDTGYQTTHVLQIVGGVDNYVALLKPTAQAPADVAAQLGTSTAYVISTYDPSTGQYLVYDSAPGGVRTLTTMMPGKAYIVRPATSTTWTVTA